MSDQEKRYVKEFELNSTEVQNRARNMIEASQRNLFVVEYGGRDVVKLPLIAVIAIGVVGGFTALPWIAIVFIALVVLRYLGKLNIRIQRR